ncbi:phage portal protein [Clostridium perfringens]|nr:phage portal protein [Clostridium perfringens]
MKWFKKKTEKRENESFEDLLLNGKLGIDVITETKAKQIPNFNASLNYISNIFATVPVKLYEENDGVIQELKNDNRVKLLNDNCKDLLSIYNVKQRLINDYYCKGQGYIYINRKGNDVISLHYIDSSNISYIPNLDPIFKDAKIQINGKEYETYEFLSLVRNTKDGVSGTSIISENDLSLSTTYNSLRFENKQLCNGGLKKGLFKVAEIKNKETFEVILANLKKTWKKLWDSNSDEEENCLVLNGDMNYQDISYNPKDMQLLELKKENNTDICKLFNVDPALLNGNATEEQFLLFVKTVILPLFKQFEEVLNKNLLLEREKDSYYFAFDTRELLKADILKRYQAYEIGLRNTFLELNDVRYMENMDKLEGFEDVVKLGLDTVLYNTKNKDIFVANTNTTSNINGEGGDDNGNS